MQLPEYVTLHQINLFINCTPQSCPESNICLTINGRQIPIDCIYHQLKVWFTRELMRLHITEIIIWVKWCIQGGNQIEQHLATDCVTQHSFLLTSCAQPSLPCTSKDCRVIAVGRWYACWVCSLWWWQGLKFMRGTSFIQTLI